YTGTINMGGITLTGGSIFVAKYNADGTIAWARSTGSGTITPTDITVDASGNYYITGSFLGTATFGGQSLTSVVEGDAFIVKFNQSGIGLWARSQNGGGLNYSHAGNDIGTGISVDD